MICAYSRMIGHEARTSDDLHSQPLPTSIAHGPFRRARASTSDTAQGARPQPPEILTRSAGSAPASTAVWEDQFTQQGDRVDAPPLPLPPISTRKRVVLVRHGQSTWNAEGRIQGSSNAAVLTEKGKSQALTTARYVSGPAWPHPPHVHALRISSNPVAHFKINRYAE